MKGLFNRGINIIPFTHYSPVMGTIVYQEIYALHGRWVAGKADQELHRLQTLWSPYQRGNIIDTIRQSAGKKRVQLDPDTMSILTTAKGYFSLSQGAFDVTIDPLVRLFGEAAKGGLPPSQGQIESLLPLVHMEHLQLHSKAQLYLPYQGQGIDLGGIGKGYAAERIRAIYQEMGIQHALINMGGHVLLLNSKVDGSPWRVGIKDPASPSGPLVGYIEAEDCSVVTSGDYERFYDYPRERNKGKRFHHLLDPKTGWPVDNGISGVTVVSSSSILADVLATSIFVLGVKKGLAFCHSFEDAQALLIDKKGYLYLSDGMVDLFKPIGIGSS